MKETQSARLARIADALEHAWRRSYLEDQSNAVKNLAEQTRKSPLTDALYAALLDAEALAAEVAGNSSPENLKTAW